MVGAAAIAVAAVGGLNVPQAEGLTASLQTDEDQVDAGEAAALEATQTTDAVTAVIEQQRTDRTRAQRAAERAAEEKREAERKRAEEEAARREAMRPKYVLPVTNYRLTASFGDGGGLWANNHTGQDFAAPYGTTVRSAHDGVITFAGWDGSYGYKIAVRHADGTETWYAHLSSITRSSGAVKAGDTIGRVGSTGNSTGSHLHFEVRINGGDTPIGPLTWLRNRGVSV